MRKLKAILGSFQQVNYAEANTNKTTNENIKYKYEKENVLE